MSRGIPHSSSKQSVGHLFSCTSAWQNLSEVRGKATRHGSRGYSITKDSLVALVEYTADDGDRLQSCPWRKVEHENTSLSQPRHGLSYVDSSQVRVCRAQYTSSVLMKKEKLTVPRIVGYTTRTTAVCCLLRWSCWVRFYTILAVFVVFTVFALLINAEEHRISLVIRPWPTALDGYYSAGTQQRRLRRESERRNKILWCRVVG